MCKHIFNWDSYQENEDGDVVETCQLCWEPQKEKVIMSEPERGYTDKYYWFISSIFWNNLSEEKKKDLENIIEKIYQDWYEDWVNNS